MLLILLHRLKFSIKDDVLILAFMIFFLHSAVRKSCAAESYDHETLSYQYQPQQNSNNDPNSIPYGGVRGDILNNISRDRRRRNVGNNFVSANLPYDNFIYNIRQANDVLRIRKNKNIRWHQIDAVDKFVSRRTKRNVITEDAITNASVQSTENVTQIAWKNSTKILNFNKRNLTGIVELKHLNETIMADNLFGDILVLNFAQNKIKRFDNNTLNVFTNITNLNLADNQIEKFPLFTSIRTQFNRLMQLNLSENILTFFDGNQTKNLQKIDLSCNTFNEPMQLNLSQLSNLEYIDLSCNHLNALHVKTFQNLSNLRTLNLAGNSLKEIQKNYFYNLIQIEFLILSNNNITTIENDAFVYLPNLQFLDLSHNRLSVASIHSLQAIPDLTSLSVAYNRDLGNALQGFVSSWSLKELDASGTGLCQIPAALAQSVHTLNISNNHFQVIRCGDLDSYPLLQHLDISSCAIDEIEDDALGRLEILSSLYLQNNRLLRIPTSLPTHLQHLNLANNRIMDINASTFSQLSTLKTLNLAENKLMYVPGLPLPHLVTLNLRSANVKTLSQSIVKMSPNLKDLFLDGNPIKCSELLSIAEWATPCSPDKIDDGNDGDDNDEYNNEKYNKFPILFRELNIVDRFNCKWCHKWQPVKIDSIAANNVKCVSDEQLNKSNAAHANPKPKNKPNAIKPVNKMTTTQIPTTIQSSLNPSNSDKIVLPVTEIPSTKLNTVNTKTISVTSRPLTTSSTKISLTSTFASNKSNTSEHIKTKSLLSLPKKSEKSDSMRVKLTKSDIVAPTSSAMPIFTETQMEKIKIASTESSLTGLKAKSTMPTATISVEQHKSDVLVITASKAESTIDPVTLPNDVIRAHSTAKQTTIENVSRSQIYKIEKTKETTTKTMLKNDDNDVHKTEETLNLNRTKEMMPTTMDLLSSSNRIGNRNRSSSENNKKRLPTATNKTETSNKNVARKNSTHLYKNERETSTIRAQVQTESLNDAHALNHQNESKIKTKINKIMDDLMLASPANDRNYFRINDDINTNSNGQINDNKTIVQTNELVAAPPTTTTMRETKTTLAPLLSTRTLPSILSTTMNITNAKKQRKLKKLIKTKQNAATGRADSIGNSNNNNNNESMDLVHIDCETEKISSNDNNNGKKCKPNILLVDEKSELIETKASSGNKSDDVRRFFLALNESVQNISVETFFNKSMRAQPSLTATKETHSTNDRISEIDGNTSTLSGFTEPLNYIRESPGHPGVFIVIGVTIGIFITVCLVHLYRCNKPYVRRSQRYNDCHDDQEQYIVPHHTSLPLDTFGAVESRYTDTPIDLW